MSVRRGHGARQKARLAKGQPCSLITTVMKNKLILQEYGILMMQLPPTKPHLLKSMPHPTKRPACEPFRDAIQTTSQSQHNQPS